MFIGFHIIILPNTYNNNASPSEMSQFDEIWRANFQGVSLLLRKASWWKRSNVCLKPWRTDVMGFGGSDVWAVSFPCQVWQCFCKGEWWSQSCIRKLYVEALYTDLEISPSLLNDWVTEVVFKKWLWNRNFCDMIACTSCGNTLCSLSGIASHCLVREMDHGMQTMQVEHNIENISRQTQYKTMRHIYAHIIYIYVFRIHITYALRFVSVVTSCFQNL